MQAASVLYPSRAWGARGPIRRIGEKSSMFLVALAVYLAAAVELVLVRHAVIPEALSRVANAYFVVYSRDPHLPAIGFVWNPLPSLLTMPLLPLKAIWPALTELGFAANLISAVFMAGAVVQLYRLLREQGVARRLGMVLTALAAVHPLVVYAAASGLPYALLMFCLLVAIRHLALWSKRDDIAHLTIAGLALACAYLTRTEALLAVAAAGLLVAVVSFRRANREDGRAAVALCDFTILVGPVVLAMAVWFTSAWIITGDPLYQLTSVYGSGARLAALIGGGPSHLLQVSSVTAAALRLLMLAPGLIACGAVLIGLKGSASHASVALALLGPLLIVMIAAQVTGFIEPSLHTLLMLVPLTAVFAGAITSKRSHTQHAGVALLRSCVAALLLAAAIPASGLALGNGSIGGIESAELAPVVHPGRPNPEADMLASASLVARYLDDRNLPEGSVLLDSSTGFPIVLASRSPRQFVITNDRDFRLALSDPVGSGIAYLIAPVASVAGQPPLDAINRAYPDLGQLSGVGILIRQFGVGDVAAWRLYAVKGG